MYVQYLLTLTFAGEPLASKRSLRTFHDFCPIGRPIHSTTATIVGEGCHTLIELLHLVTRNASISCYFYFSPSFRI